MPDPNFFVKQGDTAAAITRTLEDANGDPVDIEAATITFRMRPLNGGATVVDDDADNLQDGDGTTGQVQYEWATGDTDTPGLYAAEWEVTFGDGTQTYPNAGYDLVLITPKIADAA